MGAPPTLRPPRPRVEAGRTRLARGMQISRTALVPFVVFFSAWETLQGIATGILAADYRSQPQARRLQ